MVGAGSSPDVAVIDSGCAGGACAASTGLAARNQTWVENRLTDMGGLQPRHPGGFCWARTTYLSVVPAVLLAALVGCGAPAAAPPVTSPASTSSVTAPSDVLVPAPSTGPVPAACTTPTSLIAPVVYMHTSGPVSAGQSPPPDPLDTQTLYIGGGRPGAGLLCHGSTKSGPPALSATAATTGVVPYLAEDGNGFWGAVGPGTTKVELAVSGYQGTYTFTVDDPDVSLELRDLGDGWHAFNTATGFSPPNPVATATAYDAAGHALGSRTINAS